MIKKISHLFSKIRNKGIVGSVSAVITRLKRFLDIHYKFVKFIFSTKPTGKRILGIWDYKALPWSIGDPLMFVEKLSIMKIENNAEKVDICIIYDPNMPGGNRKEKKITVDNVQDFMFDYLPLFTTCPYLGSVFLFNSRKELSGFLKSNIERYNIFPPLAEHLLEKYNFVGGEPHTFEIQNFFNAHGYIPYLRIGERETKWVQWFYTNILPKNAVPVVLSMRQPLSTLSERNANPLVWLSFIDRCRIDFPEILFVVVGCRDEVFDGLMEMPNVVIAKSYGTSIIEDLALVRSSFLYLATTSGINTIVMFSDTPYLIFQMPNINSYGLEIEDRFSFSTDKQKVFGTEISVTPDLLYGEFKKLYRKLDTKEWHIRVFGNNEKEIDE